MNSMHLSPRVQIVLFNLVPLVGVAYFDWSPFALFYAFWLETLSISFLNSIAILFAQGDGWSGKNASRAISFFLVQIGILLFYLLFIIAFIGLQIDYGPNQPHFVEFLILIEPSFRWTVLILFGLKVLEMLYFYFYKKAFLVHIPDDFYYAFSGRTIVIHIVTVLGFFSYNFLKTHLNNQAGLLIFTLVFVVTKIIFELLLTHRTLSENQKIN